HGAVPPAEGYRVDERFYRRSAARGLDAPARLPFKAGQHPPAMLAPPRAPRTPADHLPAMLRLRRALDADVVHYQWLTVPSLDARLLPPRRPRAMTAHYILAPP